MRPLRMLVLAAAAVAAVATPALAEPLLLGVFTGVLPCADCSGIRTELTLVRKASGWAEGRYRLRETYLGRAVKPFTTLGEWTTLKGDATDDNAVVYELDPAKPTRHFLKVGETRVRLLDKDLKPLPATLPQTSARQTRGLPDAAAVDCLRRGGAPEGGKCGRAAPSR